MITKLAEILDPRARRTYVGRHRAEELQRFVARVPVQQVRRAAEHSHTSM